MTVTEDAHVTIPEDEAEPAADEHEDAADAARALEAARTAAADLSPLRVVEAALFSAGKPLALADIAENTGLGKRAVTSALKKLVQEYDERDTALEVGQAGDKWAMQVRAKYAAATERLAPMEIPVRVLKTLALIAYHQPLLQSDLTTMVGSKAYDHVRELYERGLIRKRVHERTFTLVTTDRFPEYFGIPSQERDEIKEFLADKLGIRVPPKPSASKRKKAQKPKAPPAGQGQLPQDASPAEPQGAESGGSAAAAPEAPAEQADAAEPPEREAVRDAEAEGATDPDAVRDAERSPDVAAGDEEE